MVLNYTVHDPLLTGVRSAFWHLKRVSGVVALYRFGYLIRCENQGFGISQKTAFFAHHLLDTGFFLPWSQLTYLAALQNLARKTLGWHVPRSLTSRACLKAQEPVRSVASRAYLKFLERFRRVASRNLRLHKRLSMKVKVMSKHTKHGMKNVKQHKKKQGQIRSWSNYTEAVKTGIRPKLEPHQPKKRFWFIQNVNFVQKREQKKTSCQTIAVATEIWDPGEKHLQGCVP